MCVSVYTHTHNHTYEKGRQAGRQAAGTGDKMPQRMSLVLLEAPNAKHQNYKKIIAIILQNNPTKAQLQLIYKLSRCYMFRHYRVISDSSYS